ncbi:ABC transporter permease [Aestuariivirga sp.]|uniref:ABC transporter permease n=1 Tax=Aestuariivirga sp. TaxID=2650926 RepID=UPI003BA9D211
MRQLAIRLLLFGLAASLPLIFVVLPIGTFLVLSFFHMENNQIVYAFGISNYVNFFRSWTYLGTFLGTLWLCMQVMLICMALGYPIAWFVWRRAGTLRYFLLLLTVLPLFMSYIVKLYTIRSVLGLNGLLNQTLMGLGLLDKPSLLFLFNQHAVLGTMSVLYLPFAILPIFLTLERIPAILLDASRDLGASPWSTFRHIVFPLALPGTVAGALFTFVLALGDFVTPQMVGGTTGFTFGRVIWSQFGLAYNWPFGAAMAAILLLTAFIIIILAGYSASRQRV